MIILKRIIILLALSTIFVGCTTICEDYSYVSGIDLYNPEDTNQVEYRKYIYVSILVKDDDVKNSPISYILLKPQYYNDKNKHEKTKEIRILNDKIKIINNGKEYLVDVDQDKSGISLYKRGIYIAGDSIIYFGKVEINNKKVIEVPPLMLKEFVKVTTCNVASLTLDAIIDKNTQKELYSGEVEGR